MKSAAVKAVVVNAKLRNWIFVLVETDVLVLGSRPRRPPAARIAKIAHSGARESRRRRV